MANHFYDLPCEIIDIIHGLNVKRNYSDMINELIRNNKFKKAQVINAVAVFLKQVHDIYLLEDIMDEYEWGSQAGYIDDTFINTYGPDIMDLFNDGDEEKEVLLDVCAQTGREWSGDSHVFIQV